MWYLENKSNVRYAPPHESLAGLLHFRNSAGSRRRADVGRGLSTFRSTTLLTYLDSRCPLVFTTPSNVTAHETVNSATFTVCANASNTKLVLGSSIFLQHHPTVKPRRNHGRVQTISLSPRTRRRCKPPSIPEGQRAHLSLQARPLIILTIFAVRFEV